jgi:hypothetical protein
MAENAIGPIPDKRPEEAREAIESLDAVMRRVFDWRDQHPHEPDRAVRRLKSDYETRPSHGSTRDQPTSREAPRRTLSNGPVTTECGPL